MKELTVLQVLMLETEVKEIGQAIMELHKSYKTALNEAKTVNEGVDDFLQSDDIGFIFDEAKKRYLAAKQGLGLVNKLTDPAQRSENAKRVMGNLNKLRAIFNRLQGSVKKEVDGLLAKVRDKQAQPVAPQAAPPQSRPVAPQQQQQQQQPQQAAVA
jgi:hypothetical protein